MSTLRVNTIRNAAGSSPTDASQIGINQTWQAVTRTSGVPYVNNTGRPIMINFNANSNSATVGVDISIDGGPNIRFVNAAAGTGPVVAAGQFIVPIGSTYTLTETNVAARAVHELRL